MCGQNLKEKQYITIQKETEQNEKESKKFGGGYEIRAVSAESRNYLFSRA